VTPTFCSRGRGLGCAVYPRRYPHRGSYADLDARCGEDVRWDGTVSASSESRLVVGSVLMAHRSIRMRMRSGGALGTDAVSVVGRLVSRAARDRLRPCLLPRRSTGDELRVVGRARREQVQPTDQHAHRQGEECHGAADTGSWHPMPQHTDEVAHSSRTVPASSAGPSVHPSVGASSHNTCSTSYRTRALDTTMDVSTKNCRSVRREHATSPVWPPAGRRPTVNG